ncbi:hypothetical protein Vadar_007074 [Vaccinium darrowii]|uniref:Uncharacterized protein n=1 Tax=Vaccinium darrowii TaxID=229202 RepID=A0ACB7WYH9_9ERIC|nr:hypothetical protein Vadar_007074 [Vaccinium darrowii]
MGRGHKRPRAGEITQAPMDSTNALVIFTKEWVENARARTAGAKFDAEKHAEEAGEAWKNMDAIERKKYETLVQTTRDYKAENTMSQEKNISRTELCTRMAKQLVLENIEKGNYENVVLSPLSIDVVLNMVAAGLRGRALEKMLGFLDSQNINEIKSQSLKMMAVAVVDKDEDDRYLENGDPVVGTAEDEPVVCLVNGAWFDQRFTPKPSYKEDVLKGIYGCEAKTVDFVTRAVQVVEVDLVLFLFSIFGLRSRFLHRDENPLEVDEVVDEINLWAEAASKGLIKKIVQRGSLARQTGLILANAILQRKLETTSEMDCKIFWLISKSGFAHKYSCLDKRKLDKFWIPKFKFSYDFDVSLTMKEMGMPFPFMENPEDFAEMVEVPKGLPFIVPRMVQKACIEVDEKGSKAAAIAGCAPATYSGYRPKNKSFVADHPFVFMIMEERSSLVLFTGAVLDPTKVE